MIWIFESDMGVRNLEEFNIFDSILHFTPRADVLQQNGLNSRGLKNNRPDERL